MSDSIQRGRILICGEHLTPSHIARPLRIAEWLHETGMYDVHVGTPSLPTSYSVRSGVSYHTLPSPDSHTLEQRVRRVMLPLYQRSEIREMVDAEESLVRGIQPDIILHDFRNTLALSTYGTNIPLISLNDFYWHESFPYTHLMPDTPLSPYVGYANARKIGTYLAPIVEKLHIAPFNAVARARGIPPFRNLRHLYNSADEMWLFDIEGVLPRGSAPLGHFIGPVLWEQGGDIPPWLTALPDHSALCLTFSSSGEGRDVERAIRALKPLGMPIVVLTGGKYTLSSSEGVHVADFLPIQDVLKKSRVCICHGGSSLVYHALTAKVPVVGVPHNITQWFSMYRFAEMGIGTLVPIEHAGDAVLTQAVAGLLDTASYQGHIQEYRAQLAQTDTRQRVHDGVKRIHNAH